MPGDRKTAVNLIYPHKLFSNKDSYNKYITKKTFPKNRQSNTWIWKKGPLRLIFFPVLIVI